MKRRRPTSNSTSRRGTGPTSHETNAAQSAGGPIALSGKPGAGGDGTAATPRTRSPSDIGGYYADCADSPLLARGANSAVNATTPSNKTPDGSACGSAAGRTAAGRFHVFAPDQKSLGAPHVGEPRTKRPAVVSADSRTPRSARKLSAPRRARGRPTKSGLFRPDRRHAGCAIPPRIITKRRLRSVQPGAEQLRGRPARVIGGGPSPANAVYIHSRADASAASNALANALRYSTPE